MPIKLLSLHCGFATFIRTSNTELLHKPSNGYVGLDLTDHSHVTERASPSAFDTFLAEKIVTARSFNGVIIDVETDWADPAIVS